MCEPANAREAEIEATARPRGRGQSSSGGDVVAYQQHPAQRHGVGGWSRTRWIVLAALLVAVAVAIILALSYSGGSGGGGY